MALNARSRARAPGRGLHLRLLSVPDMRAHTHIRTIKLREQAAAETLTRRAQTSMINELGREPYFADVPCEALLQRHYPAHFAVGKTRPDFSVYFRRKSREPAAPAG